MNLKVISVLLLLPLINIQVWAGPFDGELDDAEWLARQKYLQRIYQRPEPKNIAGPRTIKNTSGWWGEVGSTDVENILRKIKDPGVKDQFVQNLKKYRPKRIGGVADIRLLIISAALAAGVTIATVNDALASSTPIMSEDTSTSQVASGILTDNAKKLLEKDSTEDFESTLTNRKQ